MIERRVGEERVGRAVLDRRPLEPEEEELRLEGRALLPQLRDECAAGGLGHVGREKHVRVVESARCDRLDPLALVNRLGELGGGEGCDLAVVAVAEGSRCGFGLGEVGFDLGIINGGVEAGEVPGNVFGASLLNGCHGSQISRSVRLRGAHQSASPTMIRTPSALNRATSRSVCSVTFPPSSFRSIPHPSAAVDERPSGTVTTTTLAPSSRTS